MNARLSYDRQLITQPEGAGDSKPTKHSHSDTSKTPAIYGDGLQ